MARRADIGPDAEREERELREYLGAEFDRARLVEHERQVEEEFERLGDEAQLYRTSRGYLYDLTAFAMSGTKLPYLRRLTRLLPAGARILDYGCGIGSDGLLLAEAGFRVEFADFDNPSVEYLRWRLQRRGLSAPVHDIDEHVPGGFDGAYAFDVIEHVDDPEQFLGALEQRSQLVMVNLLAPEPGETSLHHELPIDALLARAAGRQLRYYGLHYGRSNLVAYGPQRVGAARSVLQRARIALRRRVARSGARAAAS